MHIIQYTTVNTTVYTTQLTLCFDYYRIAFSTYQSIYFLQIPLQEIYQVFHIPIILLFTNTSIGNLPSSPHTNHSTFYKYLYRKSTKFSTYQSFYFLQIPLQEIYQVLHIPIILLFTNTSIGNLPSSPHTNHSTFYKYFYRKSTKFSI